MEMYERDVACQSGAESGMGITMRKREPADVTAMMWMSWSKLTMTAGLGMTGSENIKRIGGALVESEMSSRMCPS